MQEEIYNISQHIHDTVKRIKEAGPSVPIDVIPVFNLQVIYDVGEATEHGRKPQITLWMKEGTPEEFPIFADDPAPYFDWRSYGLAVIREFRTFCRNASIDFLQKTLEEPNNGDRSYVPF